MLGHIIHTHSLILSVNFCRHRKVKHSILFKATAPSPNRYKQWMRGEIPGKRGKLLRHGITGELYYFPYFLFFPFFSNTLTNTPCMRDSGCRQSVRRETDDKQCALLSI